MSLALLLGIILCLCCLTFNKSKGVFYVSLFYLWIMFAGAYGHADYFSSETSYNLILNTNIGIEDPLWHLIQKGFLRCGFSYQEFLAITSALLLLIMAAAIRHLTKNIGVVLGLYMICPFALDVVQYNNFAGMVLVLFATQYLTKKRHSVVKFLVWMGLAAGICSYCVVYFAFLLVFLERKRLYQIMMILVPVIAVVPTIVFYIAQRFVNVEKVKAYLSKQNNLNTVIGLELLVVLYIVLIICLEYFTRKGKFVKQFDTSRFQNLELILKINIIMTITLALQLYSLETARFYRNIFILDYVAISYIRYINIGVGTGNMPTKVANKVGTGMRRLRTGVFELVLFMGAFAYSYLYVFHWNRTSVLVPVFEYNLFFGWL